MPVFFHRKGRMRPYLRLSGWLAGSLAALAGPIQFAPPMAEPSPFLLWDLSTTLRPSVGYKTNPTLANTAFREGSSFINLGVELLLFRLPTGPDSFHFYFSADDRRYVDSRDRKSVV